MDTIGEILKNARLAKGLTIEELQQLTKIQKRHLEALEKNDFDALPGTYYTRTFIRQYANEVGVDGAYLVNRFDGQPVTEQQKIEAAVRGSRSELYKGNHSGGSFSERLPAILLAVVSILIVGSVAYLTLREDSKKPMIEDATDLTVEQTITKETSTSSSEPKKETETSETKETEEKEEGVKVAFESENGDNINLKVSQVPEPLTLTFESTNGPCWIGVLINGVYHYEYTLQAGEISSTELPAGTSEADVVLGASPNVKVSVNDKDLDFNPNQTNIIKRNLHLNIDYQE